MHTMQCPICGKEIELISFGGSWLGMCNFEIVYDSYQLPEDCREQGVISVSDEKRFLQGGAPGKVRSNTILGKE